MWLEGVGAAATAFPLRKRHCISDLCSVFCPHLLEPVAPWLDRPVLAFPLQLPCRWKQIRGATNRSRRTCSRPPVCPCMGNACSACQPSWGSWRPCDTAAEQVVCPPARAGCTRRAPPEALRTNSQASSPRSWRVDLVPFEDSDRRSRRQQQQNLAAQGGQEGVVAA